jgi:hypothetical protein
MMYFVFFSALLSLACANQVSDLDGVWTGRGLTVMPTDATNIFPVVFQTWDIMGGQIVNACSCVPFTTGVLDHPACQTNTLLENNQSVVMVNNEIFSISGPELAPGVSSYIQCMFADDNKLLCGGHSSFAGSNFESTLDMMRSDYPYSCDSPVAGPASALFVSASALVAMAVAHFF